jgi:pimeloyl-ACP methyl ester carboxylesterase
MPDLNNLESVSVSGIRIEKLSKGQGQQFLFLHSEQGLGSAAPAIDRLAEHGRVTAVSHPGWDRSELPQSFSDIDDLAYFYLDVMEQFGMIGVTLVGCSFGGWLAAEIAIKSCARISHVVLVDALGIKISGPDVRDIADIFGVTNVALRELSYADQSRAPPDLTALDEDALKIWFRNRESLSLFGWSPFLHNPKLRGRLRRISVPTLVLWGEEDKIVSPDYGRAFAASIPGAHFECLAGSGHHPEIEQPEHFAKTISAFCSADRSAQAE